MAKRTPEKIPVIAISCGSLAENLPRFSLVITLKLPSYRTSPCEVVDALAHAERESDFLCSK